MDCKDVQFILALRLQGDEEDPMAERRRVPRYTVQKAGKIRLNGSFVDCTIRDLSSRGACLEVETPALLPDSFELLLGLDGASRFCWIVWKKAARIGVSFIEDL
jgi:hypothetical protein